MRRNIIEALPKITSTMADISGIDLKEARRIHHIPHISEVPRGDEDVHDLVETGIWARGTKSDLPEITKPNHEVRLGHLARIADKVHNLSRPDRRNVVRETRDLARRSIDYAAQGPQVTPDQVAGMGTLADVVGVTHRLRARRTVAQAGKRIGK